MREHDETGLGQVVVLVVTAQLAAHEVEKRRVVARALPLGIGEPERPRGRTLGRPRRDHALRGEQLEHEVAALERALGMPARVVVRRSAHDRDEQRDLGQVELRQRLAEVELAREAEAMHGAPAVLAEVNLVDVRVHDVRLLEARLRE